MRYMTDLTDKQWHLTEQIFESKKGRHLAKHKKRDLENAILYLVKTACQWRLLPNNFPPHDTVCLFYRRAVKSGKWEKVMDCLAKQTREDAGRKPSPTYGIIDSQSVKTIVAS